MIRRKISGSSTAYAWLTACAIASSQSDHIGRTSISSTAPCTAAAASAWAVSPATAIGSGRSSASTHQSSNMLA